MQLDCQSATRTRKVNLPANQKGYDDSETTAGKLWSRRIHICCDYFLNQFLVSYVLKHVETGTQQK